MTGSTIGDCELIKISKLDVSRTTLPVTQEQLNEAKKIIEDRYEALKMNLMENTETQETGEWTEREELVEKYRAKTADQWKEMILGNPNGKMPADGKTPDQWKAQWGDPSPSAKWTPNSRAKELFGRGMPQTREVAWSALFELQRAKDDMDSMMAKDDRLMPNAINENNYIVGRLRGLPDAVTEKGEPILCNILPGTPAREHIENCRKDLYEKRVDEMAHLIRIWVQEVAEIFKKDGKPPKCGRAKPLLALPMASCGRGGGKPLVILFADMMAKLLPELAQEFAVDILLCLENKDHYKLFQQRRKTLTESNNLSWGRLTESNKQCAQDLALSAEQGELCFIMGTGMGIPAGLPRWGAMLEKIDKELKGPLTTKLNVKTIQEGIQKVKQERDDVDSGSWNDSFEIAEELHKAAESTEAFKTMVAKFCDSPKYAIDHAMLANVPVRSFITTTLDTLFEKACHDIAPYMGRPYERNKKMAILRGQAKGFHETQKDCNRWVLKMHGCCDHPEDIVMTADDFTSYETKVAATLTGLVQAQLVPSRLVCIGFSITDPHFRRLLELKHVITDSHGSKENLTNSNTIITLGKSDQNAKDMVERDYGLRLETIGEDLEWEVTFDANNAELNRLNTNPAREMQIFLDYLAMHSTYTLYPIFNEDFSTGLSQGEKDLKADLDSMLKTMPQDVMTTPAWNKVKEMCEELGKATLQLEPPIAGLPPAGHFFVSMADLTKVACDYWLIPCSSLDAKSLGSTRMTFKTCWLKSWLDPTSGSGLSMPGEGLGDYTVEHLCYGKVDCPPDVEEKQGVWIGHTVGRVKRNGCKGAGLPETVIAKGEPILCNILPGNMTRSVDEADRSVTNNNLHQRVIELEELIRNWVKTTVEIFTKDGKPPKCGRVKPLLALPLVGTGASGGALLTGWIADSMVVLLPALADEFAVDIILCLTTEDDFMLVQQRRQMHSTANKWSQLTAENMDDAKQLAEHAKKGEMCLFFGAGLSISAGLPRWEAMLENIDKDLLGPLTTKHDVTTIQEGIEKVKQEKLASKELIRCKDGKLVKREDVGELDKEHVKTWNDSLEIAEELHKAAVSPLAFKQAVAKYCDSPKYAIGHSMLACMPTKSTITTNFDTMFEKACYGVAILKTLHEDGKLVQTKNEERHYGLAKMAILFATKQARKALTGCAWEEADLPHSTKKDCNRWLLKVHGCCNRPESLMITADDYAKYESENEQSLRALSQAELMTSHVLFTGFSMEDPHFKQLVKVVMESTAASKSSAAVDNKSDSQLFAGKYSEDPSAENLEKLTKAIAIENVKKGNRSITDGNLKASERICSGTAISIGKVSEAKYDELFKTQLKYGFRIVSIADKIDWNEWSNDPEKKSNTNPARELEVFMDYLLMLSTDTAYPILDSKFETSLTHGERLLKTHLRKFLFKLPDTVVNTPAWEQVKRMLKELGSESKRVTEHHHNAATE